MVRKLHPAENARSLPFPLENEAIADRLNEVAAWLESKDANPFRVKAYRNAANTVRALETPISDILESHGPQSLKELPGIGESIAQTIEKLCGSGSVALLDRLRGRAIPKTVLTTVAGVGPKTAAMIHEKLGIDTLEDLEAAANDGRLNTVPGMGHKRLRSVRESLAGRLQRFPRPNRNLSSRMPEPSVKDLLSIDQEYRRKAGSGRLVQIVPSRFNPEGKAWLPILHTRRDGHHFTALFSNSPLAHQLNATHDWVVIYCKGDERQWTVVTDHRGSGAGRRIVRGREAECDAHYAQLAETQ